MSQQEAELAVRMRSVQQLGTIVHALRGIAAGHVQQSRRRLQGVRRYADTVAGAIAQALALLPDGAAPPLSDARTPTLLVVFCAEQGFAGGFSEAVFDAADPEPGTNGLIVVGRRGRRTAAARELAPLWWTPSVATAAGAAALAERIATAVYRGITSGTRRAEMVFTRPRDGASVEIERRRLLPVDLSRFAPMNRSVPPLIQLPPQVLLEKLTGEYLRAQLAEAILCSFAAENLARMTAMASAGDNVRQMLESLTRQARMARQQSITAEVVELATGTSALRRPPAAGR